MADTGRCALERNPEDCSNRIGAAPVAETNAPSTTDGDTSTIGAPVLDAPFEIPSFPPSRTLSPETIEAMMARRYVTVVGILGDPESGKTACLASLYLLISNAALDGWTFCDSRSLMAFEEISRGARRWSDGHPPDQMTVHTEMADERRPGFLHLRLRRQLDGRRVDLALPDLPGEWTKTLIRSAKSDRLEFLKSADVIWLVVDGRTLADREKRQGTITRLGQLAGRLRGLIEGQMPRLLLAITHHDLNAPDEAVLDRIQVEFGKHSVTTEVIPVAPFSDRDNIRPGFGLAELINASCGRSRSVSVFWPETEPTVGKRSYLTYRRGQ